MKFALYSNLEIMLIEHGAYFAAEYAKKMGFSGLELVALVDRDAIPDLKEAQRIKAIMDSYDLLFVCYSVPCNVYHEDVLDEMKKRIEIAAELGSPYVHHTLMPGIFLKDSIYEENAISKCVDVAEKIANFADGYGITCIYEQQGFCVNGFDNYVLFYDEMKKRCANVGVCADFGNSLFVGEQPTKLIEKYVSDIKQVHFKDYITKNTSVNPGLHWRELPNNNWLRNIMVGHGEVEYDKCLKLLKDSGYNGYYSLELAHPEPFDEGVKQAMEYTERLFNIL